MCYYLDKRMMFDLSASSYCTKVILVREKKKTVKKAGK